MSLSNDTQNDLNYPQIDQITNSLEKPGEKFKYKRQKVQFSQLSSLVNQLFANKNSREYITISSMITTFLCIRNINSPSDHNYPQENNRFPEQNDDVLLDLLCSEFLDGNDLILTTIELIHKIIFSNKEFSPIHRSNLLHIQRKLMNSYLKSLYQTELK